MHIPFPLQDGGLKNSTLGMNCQKILIFDHAGLMGRLLFAHQIYGTTSQRSHCQQGHYDG
jgi:hypothetical protein